MGIYSGLSAGLSSIQIIIYLNVGLALAGQQRISKYDYPFGVEKKASQSEVCSHSLYSKKTNKQKLNIFRKRNIFLHHCSIMFHLQCFTFLGRRHVHLTHFFVASTEIYGDEQNVHSRVLQSVTPDSPEGHGFGAWVWWHFPPGDQLPSVVC